MKKNERFTKRIYYINDFIPEIWPGLLDEASQLFILDRNLRGDPFHLKTNEKDVFFNYWEAFKRLQLLIKQRKQK